MAYAGKVASARLSSGSNVQPRREECVVKEFEYAAAAAAAKSLQSCPTLCDPIDGSPPGSTIPGILQARPLGWVAISFSNACKRKVKVKPLSRVQLLATPWTAAHHSSVHGIFQAGVMEWGATAFSDLNMTIRQFQWEFKGAERGQCHFSRKNL